MLDMNTNGRVGAMNKIENDHLDLKLADKAVALARQELALARHGAFETAGQRQEQLDAAYAQVRLAVKHLNEVLERHPEPKRR